MRLKDKVAIISGGSRGMGAAEGRLFAKEGAKVVLGDLREELGQEVAKEITNSGGEAIFLKLDVVSEDSWNSVIAETVARFSKLDILINNAGITASGGVLETSGETWDQGNGGKCQGRVPGHQGRHT